MAVGTSALIAGGSILGKVVAGKKADKAARRATDAQLEGARIATEEQRRQFDTTTESLAAAEEANRAALTAGGTASIASQQEGFGRQQRQLGQFAGAGREALQQQRALLGLGTPEQQQAAFSQFADSPGQRFIRDRAQKELLRGASSRGQFLGGNVLSALNEQGAGFAAQDFGNQFNRLSDLRTAGQNAATNIGQGALTTGANVGQTQFNVGAGIGSGAINTAARQGQFGQNFASNIGNLAIGAGNARATGLQNRSNIFQDVLGGVTETAGSFFGG